MQFQGYIFLHFDFLMLCGSVKYLNFSAKKLTKKFNKIKIRKNETFFLWFSPTVFCAFVTFEIKVYDHSFRKGRWKDLRMHFLTQIYVETTSLKTKVSNKRTCILPNQNRSCWAFKLIPKSALDFDLRVISSFRSPFSTLRFSLKIKYFI